MNTDKCFRIVGRVEEFEFEFDPGVIINGIPAPEVLLALEQQRIAYD